MNCCHFKRGKIIKNQLFPFWKQLKNQQAGHSCKTAKRVHFPTLRQEKQWRQVRHFYNGHQTRLSKAWGTI
nr:MAG TPA: hypothetical protein [Caudoviricetes sp.]DAS47792.1 MAG TPA: hypothetical protein [Caudoviricetes sp.]